MFDLELYEYRLSFGLPLDWYFGVNCDPCCGYHPKFESNHKFDEKCRYYCIVCGTSTDWFDMPWLACDAWNAGNFLPGQLSLF